MANFNDRLREIMKEKKISQKALAEKLCITQPAISKWITGDREPNLDFLKKLCYYLDEDPAYLLGYDPAEYDDVK